ncbi:ATP-binding protein [Kitasatospora sp. HPMI-4]|uniref:ATP-binding protein n=1 Tax=Kitasatospora sp. HPMI-4 TaxID=3448443 RepID=UPI003F1B6EC3
MTDDDVLGASWPLTPFDGAVGFARRLVIATLRPWGFELGDRADDVALLVSELLTNAFSYSNGQLVTLGLYASRSEHALTLDVLDGSSDHPELRAADDDAEHGRGLFIVDHLTAGCWTSQATDRGKRVLATLTLPVGIQFAPGQCTMADEAAALEALLEKSGIAFDVVQLPMFLENILYQCQSIAETGAFTFPVDADRPFSYISCDDDADLFCLKILSPDSVDLSGTLMSHHAQATCAQWASVLGEVCGRPITFARQTDEHFVASLAKYGMRRDAAAQVLGLWGRISTEGDAPATRTAEQLLGRPSTDLETWTKAHVCCFGPEFTSCPHPHPPTQHMFGPA